MIRILSLLTLVLVISTDALAADRSSVVQARIQSALSNVLPKSDYLVIVNRLDELEGGSAAPIDGFVRALPGLSVGVDSNGQVVNKDTGSDYNGPIAISLMIDPVVKAETFELIKKTMPELAGGLRDLDEFKVVKASLRQPLPPSNSAPQISIQNQAPKDEQSGWSDVVRQMAAVLLLGGIMIWFMSRLFDKERPSQVSPASQAAQRDSEGKEKKKDQVDFKELDSHVVGLYLLKELRDRKISKVATWARETEPSEQRRILKTLPGWAASFLEQRLEEKNVFEAPSESVGMVYREIAVLEQNLKSEADRHRAFLAWFPAPALRLVGPRQLESLSLESKKTMMRLRHDLGNLVRVDEIDLESSSAEPSNEEIKSAWSEFESWKSKSVLTEQGHERDVVSRLAAALNSLTEFGPISQQLEQTKLRVSEADFRKLDQAVVSATTPLKWDTERLKVWLRTVDPHDYLYWETICPVAPTWNLNDLLRPMRRTMFERARQEPLYPGWSENAKKEAAIRLLQQLRTIHLESETQTNVEAS